MTCISQYSRQVKSEVRVVCVNEGRKGVADKWNSVGEGTMINLRNDKKVKVGLAKVP